MVGRSLGWQVTIRAGLPGKNQWQWSADSLRTIAGAATVLLCSLLGPEGHRRTLYYARFSGLDWRDPRRVCGSRAL
jgi:hypothetical protein